MTEFFIVRHGNTFEPEQESRRIGKATDLPLVASGKAQARAIGALFKAENRRFSRALVGDLRRARETAALILAAIDTAPVPEIADWLTEIDHGPDEGRPEVLVRKRIGTAALAQWERMGIPPPGWKVDEAGRTAAWCKFFHEAGVGSILCVTSNGAARFALKAIGVVPPGSVKLRTGAFGEIVRNGSSLALRAWNRRPDGADA